MLNAVLAADNGDVLVLADGDYNAISQLSKGDMFFFSGISLAVIEPATRTAFWF